MNTRHIEEITLELELQCFPEYERCLLFYPELLPEICNGVGSQTHWSYYLIPNTIWLLNINPTAAIHDWGYTYPFEFETYLEGAAFKAEADRIFYHNLEKQIAAGFWLLRPMRRIRKLFYYKVLKNSGDVAFWCNKILPPDYPKDIDKPPFDQEKFDRNLEIWKELEHFQRGLYANSP